MAPDVLQASTCIPYNHHTHMIQQIDHIGIAVKSLDATVPYYRDALGLGEPHIEEVPTQKVRVAMFDVAGVHIELLEPTSPESAIAKAIEKKGKASTTSLSRPTILPTTFPRPRTPVLPC